MPIRTFSSRKIPILHVPFFGNTKSLNLSYFGPFITNVMSCRAFPFIFPEASGHWEALKTRKKNLMFDIYTEALYIVFALSFQLR